MSPTARPPRNPIDRACQPIDCYRSALHQAGWTLAESCVWSWWEVTLTSGPHRLVVRGRTAAEAWYRAALRAAEQDAASLAVTP